MDLNIMITLFVALATMSGLIIEALKKTFETLNIEFEPAVIALIVAPLVGIGGSALYFYIQDIAFTKIVIIEIISEGVMAWLGSQIGYDKVKEVVQKLKF